ncbi:hypothetical protein E5329_04260 [Petralouisia muris]|uniref:Uncharacterized protein n=1 Tax=Petralouisia muris TaxID=3032872 RepID=A0AC61RZM1_9FIRM|nr:hypothetical protein [Petralouisia muris]TGY97594.1 hypothetical protein E5329_04260 [Petralouisia muris]
MIFMILLIGIVAFELCTNLPVKPFVVRIENGLVDGTVRMDSAETERYFSFQNNHFVYKKDNGRQCSVPYFMLY